MEHKNTIVFELEITLHRLKMMPIPDAQQIKIFRVQLDIFLQEKKITVREWRGLIEQCARVRRTLRSS